MKVSLHTLRDLTGEFGNPSNPLEQGVDHVLERIGARLGGIDEVTYVGQKYAGAVIVRVVEVQKHPNADRLHVCLVDDAGLTTDVERQENGLVQVVCGAPNVRSGMRAVWLPPGATVPSTYGHEPFVLDARELRGVISNGMLASAKELGLGDSHDGILEIIDDLPAGMPFGAQFGLTDDVIVDIENKMFTHRPDCFGWMGIARELSGIQGQAFRSPDWYRHDIALPDVPARQLKLSVRNEIPELVPRFLAVPMAGITVGPSPAWLQVRLSQVGLRPINNIVDLTNYYMLLTGQPLHAYDYDKVAAHDESDGQATLVIRKPRLQEKLELLNGKLIEPRADAIMIASETTAIGLGGVMGGGDTEVDAGTTNIILECASFDMYSIRRTAMAHGIFTDAVTRFNKGQSPLQNRAVLLKIVEDIGRLAGGSVAGEFIDDLHVSEDALQSGSLHAEVTVETSFINARLGWQLPTDSIATLLRNVEFEVSRSQSDSGEERLIVKSPFWRTDIQIPEDVVEEVGRLYGFEKLPLDLPVRSIEPAADYHPFIVQNAIRETMADSGANELLTYSFVRGSLLDKTSQDSSLAFRLSNALSPDLQYYRLSLTPSIIDKVHANIKAGFGAFCLYEIGKAHLKGEVDSGLPTEFHRLAAVYAADDKLSRNHSGAPFYQAKLYCDTVLEQFTSVKHTVVFRSYVATDVESNPALAQLAAPFDSQRSALVVYDNDVIGVVGEYTATVRRNLKLPRFSAGFEIATENFGKPAGSQYQPMPRFPKIEQDICLRVKTEVSYDQLFNLLNTELASLQPADTTSSLGPLDIYQKPSESDMKQLTFRYTIASHSRTLTDSEVARLLQLAANNVKSHVDAAIV